MSKKKSPSDLRRMKRRGLSRLAADRQEAWSEGGRPNTTYQATQALDVAFTDRRKSRRDRETPVSTEVTELEIEMRTDASGDSLIRRRKQVAPNAEEQQQLNRANRQIEVRYPDHLPE